LESRETTKITIQDRIKAGSSSYSPKIPPKGFRSSFHRNTMPPPEIIPAMIPDRVVLFQSIAGPNVAPKPAQAKETKVLRSFPQLRSELICILDE